MMVQVHFTCPSYCTHLMWLMEEAYKLCSVSKLFSLRLCTQAPIWLMWTDLYGFCCSFYVRIKSICVILQVKAEEVDLQNTAPLSDNLIDFTDPTPVVNLRPLHVQQFSPPFVISSFSEILWAAVQQEKLQTFSRAGGTYCPLQRVNHWPSTLSNLMSGLQQYVTYSPSFRHIRPMSAARTTFAPNAARL